jgi:UDP-glucose 4-epimerase
MLFVTGASGFVGLKLIKALDLFSYPLRLLSRKDNLNFETVICDLETDQIPKNALMDVDTVFHLAGYAHDLKSADKVIHLYEEINLNATIQLATLAAKSGVKKFVFLSSVKAGGVISKRCMSEKDQTYPKDHYGKTKRDAEIELLKIAENTEMNISIIRSSLIYGPGMKGNLFLMMKWINKGWFPPLPETNNCRSMVHVDDLVRSLIFVANNDKANNEIYIVTDGVPYSSRKIYETMCLIQGKKVPKLYIPELLFKLISFVNNENGHKIRKIFSDEYYSSKKINELGFQPKCSLKEMNETSF